MRSNKFVVFSLSLLVIVQLLFQLSFVLNFSFNPLTGFATSSEANVSININNVLSIVLDDNTINFSACVPGHTIFSNVSNGNSFNSCSGFVPDSLIIRNDGNLDANVTVSFSNWGEAHGGTFLNSSDNSSWVAYAIVNDSSTSFSGGCVGSFPSSWTNVTNTSHSNLLACDDLSAVNPYNSFEFNIAIFIPETTQTGNNTLLITFNAYNV